jgi:2-oxoglutarate dehydrogenase E1 component
VIEHDFSQKKEIKLLFFCTGKVYYDLLARQEKEKRSDLSIIRIEQLYPFPEKALKVLLSTYKNISATIWIQEEPQNMGAYSYVEPLIRPLISTPLEYAGRESSASPATGSKKSHDIELKQFLDQAFSRSV